MERNIPVCELFRKSCVHFLVMGGKRQRAEGKGGVQADSWVLTWAVND